MLKIRRGVVYSTAADMDFYKGNNGSVVAAKKGKEKRNDLEKMSLNDAVDLIFFQPTDPEPWVSDESKAYGFPCAEIHCTKPEKSEGDTLEEGEEDYRRAMVGMKIIAADNVLNKYNLF